MHHGLAKKAAAGSSAQKAYRTEAPPCRFGNELCKTPDRKHSVAIWFRAGVNKPTATGTADAVPKVGLYNKEACR